MSEENDLFGTEPENNIPDELETLKKRADLMGIKYHPSIGVEKLKEKIDAALGESKTVKALNTGEKQYMTHEEYKKMTLKDRKRRAANLVRINVTCMNPDKKNWEGEIFSVGSAKLGTWKKYVPFGTTDGWHVPHIIYQAMKERKCTIFQNVKDHLGQKVRKGKQINEFNIEVLPPLTKDELKDLAQRQAMARGTAEA